MRKQNLSLDLFGDYCPVPSLSKGFLNENQEEEQIKRQRLLRTLRYAVEGELTEKQKICVRKYYFDNLSQKKIAEELGITEATVSRHLKKARQRLGRVIAYSRPDLQRPPDLREQ